MVSVGGGWIRACVVSGQPGEGVKLLGEIADRQGMIPDLLLALASVVVLVSPLLLDAGKHYEFRKSQEDKQAFWND